MTHAKTYVLMRVEVDRWGRRRWTYFQRHDPGPLGRQQFTGRLRTARHYSSCSQAEERLALWGDPEGVEIVHVPVSLYPWSVSPSGSG